MTSPKTSKPESSATKSMPSPLFDKLYWLRVAFGGGGGFVAAYLFGTDYTTGILIGLIFYLASFYLARYAWFKGVGRENLGKVYSTGYGAFILVFLFTWLILWTVSHA